MDVVIKTPLELAVDDLLTAAVFVQSTVQIIRFKTLLKRLENTLKCIKPILNDSMLLSQVLNHSEEETTKFITYMQKEKEVILKFPRSKFWNVYRNSVCYNKLIQLDKVFLRFFHTGLGNNRMNTGNHINPMGISNLDQQLLAVSSTQAGSNYDSGSVPRLPNGIVGFDRHVEKLKRRLLVDHRQVLVVSGPGGCGKTTLVIMLCHDKKIKDVFGKDILYVTISRNSSIKTIVQKLFEHYGENHPEFQTDEEARNQLGDLMRRHMGSDNMLLVLDHAGSEPVSMIQDLTFPIPGYKILVTSRRSPRYSTYDLGLLNEKDARTLFCNSAFPKDGIHINVPNDLVKKIVKLCERLPLALSVAGAALCGQPILKWKTANIEWSNDYSGTYSSLLIILKQRIDALHQFPIVKECFLDISSFPGDIQIAAGSLMDMWVELYNIDNEYMFAVDSLLELSSRNLIYRSPIRKEAGDLELEGCYNELYVTQYDLVRLLAIHLSIQEPFEERKRLFIEIHENQFPTWWIEQTVQPLNTQILSISTDETFDSIWYDLIAPKVKVLALNIDSEKYILPQFIEKMDQLKVLSIMRHGLGISQLHNLAVIGCLSNLKRIRFERITVSSSIIQPIFALQNLRKLSFVFCEIGDALMSCTTESPYMLPNLTDLEIDSCFDLEELPEELCNLIQLKKLSINYCYNLNILPKELGSLSNLENLRVCHCSKLQDLPKSIGRLNKLCYMDTSDCANIRGLPEEIGDLCVLRVLNMSGCRKLQTLPMSMSKLHQLRDVICDKETLHLWMAFRSDLYRLKIHVVGNNFKSTMDTTHEEAPLIGNMVRDKKSSQTAGINFSHVPPPSYSDVAPQNGSLASESSDGQILSVVAPSIGNMVHDRKSSQTAGTNFSHGSPPSYSYVDPRKGSLASESSNVQILSEVTPSIEDMVHDKENSQTAGVSFSHGSLPSYSDVAPRKGSVASEYGDGKNVDPKGRDIERSWLIN